MTMVVLMGLLNYCIQVINTTSYAIELSYTNNHHRPVNTYSRILFDDYGSADGFT